MNKSQELEHTSSDTQIIEDGSSLQTTQQIANIQNNFHFSQTIDIDKLTLLANTSPQLADRFMSICERRQEQIEKIDSFIIDIETKEQNSRIEERPYQRKYAFRSLNYALLISLSSLVFAGYCASINLPVLAGIGITIPISIAVANMLGFKASSQKLSKKDLQELEENQTDNEK